MRCTLDLPPQALAELEQLAERLHHPSRDALVAFLVAEGLRVTRERLAEAAASDAAAQG